MAEMDMGLSPNNNKKKKKKKKQSLWKSITTGLFPCKGDTAGEICRKVIFLVALATLVAAVVLITAHYMQYVVLDNDAAIDSDGNKKTTNGYVYDLKNQTPTTQEIQNLPEGTIN